jgi:hypothetical protein
MMCGFIGDAKSTSPKFLIEGVLAVLQGFAKKRDHQVDIDLSLWVLGSKLEQGRRSFTKLNCWDCFA